MADLIAFLRGCDALLLETNYDHRQLLDGDDPPHLKRRIASREGHLSNDQAAELLDALLDDLLGDRLRHVWFAHLSRRNNSIDSVLESLRPVLEKAPHLSTCVLSQDRPAAPVELRGTDGAPVCIGVCQADANGRCLGCGRIDR